MATKEDKDDMIELYNKFDDLFDVKNFEQVDKEIETFLKEDKSAQLYVALLTICYQWQGYLKNYLQILPAAKQKLLDKGATEEQAKRTLDGFDKAPDSQLLWKNGIPYSKKL